METEHEAPAKPKLTAFARDARRERIFQRLRHGWAYESIAAAERLSEKHVRKIVGKSLRRRQIDEATDHALLQLTRLAPAMQLAAEAVSEGDVRAIPQLLKVLDRYDRYLPAARASQVYDDDIREKLLKKINRMAEAAHEETFKDEQAARLREAWADSSLAEDEPDSCPTEFSSANFGLRD
jgi:hypothetical protein